MITFSDVPPDGSGLGSSSSFTVGLANVLYALRSVHPGPQELAEEAAKVEIVKCGKPIGKQDHYFAAHGGFRMFTFERDGTVGNWAPWPDNCAVLALQKRLLLFYMGTTRKADPILREVTKNILTSREAFRTLERMAQQARDVAALIRVGSFEEIGPMLDTAWRMKQTLADGISNPQIDQWYYRALEAGAEGGKVLGAGGGGFLLFYVPLEKQEAVRVTLADLKEMAFEFTQHRSEVVFQA